MDTVKAKNKPCPNAACLVSKENNILYKKDILSLWSLQYETKKMKKNFFLKTNYRPSHETDRAVGGRRWRDGVSFCLIPLATIIGIIGIFKITVACCLLPDSLHSWIFGNE